MNKILFFLHEFTHLILSLGAGLFCYWQFGSLWLILFSLLSGFFIDTDHLFDYFIAQKSRDGKFNFNLGTFLRVGSYIGETKKIYVLFHGWEYILIFWFFGRLTGISGLEWAMSGSYFLHLLWDTVTVKPRPLAYFLTYRLSNGFTVKNFNDGRCK